MTTPYGGGFGNTDNSVAAKLSLDIPNDSVATLKELSLYTGNLAANLEAAARFSSDYMSYLSQMPQLQRQMNDSNKDLLQTMRELQSVTDNMRMAQGFSPTQQMGSTAQYYNNAINRSGFNGGAPRGTSDQQTQAPAGSSNDPSQRDSSVNNYIQAVGATPGSNLGIWGNPDANRRNVLLGQTGMGGGGGGLNGDQNTQSQRDQEIARQQNILHGRDEEARRNSDRSRNDSDGTGRHSVRTGGRHRAPDEDSEDAPTAGGSDETSSRSGISDRFRNGLNNVNSPLNDILNAGQAGNTPLGGRIALASRLLQGAGNSAGAEGAGMLGSLSPLLKGAGIAGLGVAAGGLAFNAVQNVGEEVQQYKNQDVRGHTVSGGLGIQSDIMMMSLNPLISTEQSRSIIMGALNSGYEKGGQQYDTAIQFVQKNLTDMNIDVGDSFKLLKSSVDIGKEGVGQLAAQLADLKATAAAGGTQTADQQVKGLTQVVQGLEEKGVTGAKATTEGNKFVQMFNQTIDGKANTLAGDGVSVFASALTGPTSGALIGALKNKYTPGSTILSTVSDLANSGKGKLASSITDFTKSLAVTASQQPTEQLRLQRFTQSMQIYFGISDQTKIKEIYEQFMAADEKGTDPLALGLADQHKTLGSFLGDSSVVATGDPSADASKLLTFSQWKKQPGNSTKTEADWKKYVNGGKDGEPAIKDEAFLNLVQHVDGMVVIDDTGKKLIPDTKDLNQIIGLANGSYKLAKTKADLSGVIRNPADGSLATSFLSKVGVTSSGKIIPDTGTAYRKEVSDAATAPLATAPLSLLDFKSSNDGNTLDSADSSASDSSSTTGPSGLRGNSSTFVAPSTGPTVANGSTATVPGLQIALSPQAAQVLSLIGALPGTVPNDTNTQASNKGYNGAVKNGSPVGNPGFKGYGR